LAFVDFCFPEIDTFPSTINLYPVGTPWRNHSKWACPAPEEMLNILLGFQDLHETQPNPLENGDVKPRVSSVPSNSSFSVFPAPPDISLLKESRVAKRDILYDKGNSIYLKNYGRVIIR
jgi:hypothetical protein